MYVSFASAVFFVGIVIINAIRNLEYYIWATLSYECLTIGDYHKRERVTSSNLTFIQLLLCVVLKKQKNDALNLRLIDQVVSKIDSGWKFFIPLGIIEICPLPPPMIGMAPQSYLPKLSLIEMDGPL